MTTLELDESRELVQVRRTLAEQFGGSVGRDAVDRCVREAADELAGAPIRRYVPLLVERAARQRLRALAARA